MTSQLLANGKSLAASALSAGETASIAYSMHAGHAVVTRLEVLGNQAPIEKSPHGDATPTSAANATDSGDPVEPLRSAGPAPAPLRRCPARDAPAAAPVPSDGASA